MDARKVLLVLSIILVAWAVAGCAGKKADGRAGDGEKAPLAQADAAAYPTKSTGGVDSGNVLVEATPKGMVDGRFVIPNLSIRGVEITQTSIIAGDTLSLSISAASIIAKVERDAIMRKLDARFPEYGWKKNKGYNTREHQRALRKFGLSVVHRKSFVNKG